MTNETKFTPGEWQYRKGGPLPEMLVRGNNGDEPAPLPDRVPPHVVAIRRDEEGRRVTTFVCQMYGLARDPSDGEMVANGRLAAAAPDLYLAAQFLVDFYDVGGNGEGWTLEEVVNKAREALAKARGTS